jgi:hypothetical protein
LAKEACLAEASQMPEAKAESLLRRSLGEGEWHD